MQIILNDIEALKNLRRIQIQSGASELTPIADAALRLHDLQRSIGNLRQSKDDIIVVDLIAARYVEQAIIATQGGPEAEISWSVNRDGYVRRLAEIFGKLEHQSEKSLMNRYKKVMKDAKNDLEELETEVNDMLAKISNDRDTISKVIIPPILKYKEMIDEYWLRDHIRPIIKTVTEANALYKKSKERLKSACSYETLRSFYGYLVQWSLYELIKLLPNPASEPWATDFPNLKEFYRLFKPQLRNSPKLVVKRDYERYVAIDRERLWEGIEKLVVDMNNIPRLEQYYRDRLIELNNMRIVHESVGGDYSPCENQG